MMNNNVNFVIHNKFISSKGNERTNKLELKLMDNQVNLFIHNGHRSDGTKIFGRYHFTKEQLKEFIAELQKYC